MKFIEASSRVMTELDSMSMEGRIELCGRVCYKSEDKITSDSHNKFIENVIKRGHNSVLEMAVTTFQVECKSIHSYIGLLSCRCKYLEIDEFDNSKLDSITLLITGSVRSFREAYAKYGEKSGIIRSIAVTLYKRHKLLFSGLGLENEFMSPGIVVKKMPLKMVKELPRELAKRHTFVAAKFIVDRAISHQIVRHRAASFLQESQRYCNYSDGKFNEGIKFIFPNEHADGLDWTKLHVLKNTSQIAEDAYLSLVQERNIPPQLARKVLPNMTATELIMFCNLDEWGHVLNLRCSSAADPSIRNVMIPLAEEIYSIL